ncbi:MAG TPA: ATP-binding protein [Terriglobales bacterium]|nr:ATP-binding protein [Terriglobales bacterium]
MQALELCRETGWKEMNAAAAAQGESSVTQPERVKLLLVDDDPGNLVALQAALEPLNQDLMLAGKGEDALRLCLEHQFAAILLDVRMPDMDGFETAALIRSRKSSRHTPILFLTAYRSDEQLFRGYDLGAVDFLFKPILPEILQSKVAVFVEMHRNEQLLQRQAEELGLAERRFRAALESAPDAMVITNESGTIELANSRTDVMFGYLREALIGRNLRDLIPEWQSGNLSEAADEQIGAPLPALAETRVAAIRHDGTSFPAQITRSFFRTATHYLITTAIRDATEQVEAEARVQKVNAELEKRVAERTAQLSYSNAALRQFAWAASHDLQEPVRTVLAFSQWLSTSGEDASAAERTKVLAMVHEHAARLHQLLGGLRQYIVLSELGLTSPQDEFWTLVDCNAVLRQVTANLQGQIQESNAIVERDRLPFIYGNDVLLLQLFQNLVSNAIKYRSDSPPVVRISGHAAGSTWVFSVQDNGVGIDPKYHEYVFGIFRRLDRTGGAGMGLAICKAVVERLGGRIWVESPPEGGSIFRFSMPIRRELGERATHE